MKMAYWMRIALGVALGGVSLAALWLLLGISWLTAIVAALLAVIGFLGSYFLVSADRPEDGYEQVLFDKPNTLVTLALVVAFAGAGIGTGLIGHGAATFDPAEPVRALRMDYISTADRWAKDGDNETTLAKVASLREESDRIAMELEVLPEGDGRMMLESANDAFAFALDELKSCVEAKQSSCMAARLSAADAESALTRYAALSH